MIEEHRVRTRGWFDIARPPYDGARSDRPLGRFAQLATEGAGVARIRRSIVAEIADGLAIRTIVGGKNHDGVIFHAKPFKGVEDLPDMVVAFHQLVAVIADPGFSLELRRGKVRHVSHGEGQIQEERLACSFLALHEVDGLVDQFVVDTGTDFRREGLDSS